MAYKVNRKSRVRKLPTKSIYVTVGSVVALLVLFVGAGVAYTWYVGQHSDEAFSANAQDAPTESSVAPKKDPPKPSPDAKASAAVQTFLSPVEPGSNTSLTVKTTPTAHCKITVEYNKIPSQDSGLIPKVADEYGLVSWTWTVGKTVPLGKWPATVTCDYNSRTAVVVADLEVVNATGQQ